MPKRKDEPVSAFERKRLENIAANNELLKDLSATAAKIQPPKPKPVVRAKPRARAPAERRVIPPRSINTRTRASARLRGDDATDADTSGVSNLVESGDADRPAKRLRVAEDLSLSDVFVEGRKFAKGTTVLAEMLPKRGADPGLRTFDYDQVKREGRDDDINTALKNMNSLSIYDKWDVGDIKIVPQRIYAMAFHPTEEKQLIFGGDKEGNMGLFNASQDVPVVEDDDEEEDAIASNPVIAAFKTHTRTITGFHFPVQDQNMVYTSSYDSSIRKLDLGTGTPTSVQVLAPQGSDDDLPVSAIDGPYSDPNMLIFSTLNGALGRFDIRTKPDEAEIWQVCDFKIGGFSLHPRAPHLVATASLDRTLKIWDLRKIAGKGDLRHPSLVGEHESRLSVSHASWNAVGQIATSSYDDTIKIHDFADAADWKVGHDLSDKDMAPTHSIRHNNQTGRWVTILKPQWQRNPQDGVHKFAIGNMNRFVDIYASDGSQLAQLGADGITAVPAVAHLHPTMNWVVGGTASGKVCLWV